MWFSSSFESCFASFSLYLDLNRSEKIFSRTRREKEAENQSALLDNWRFGRGWKKRTWWMPKVAILVNGYGYKDAAWHSMRVNDEKYFSHLPKLCVNEKSLYLLYLYHLGWRISTGINCINENQYRTHRMLSLLSLTYIGSKVKS